MNPQRYKNGKIYKIVNDINDQLYIGSTCLPLSKRLYNHKKECEREGSSQRQLFVLAREHGWSHFRIRLIEPYPCDDSEQLRMREQQHIDQLKLHSPQLCLNMQNSYTSEAQKRDNHKALYKQYVEKLGREEYNRRCKAYQRQPERVAYKQQWEARHKDRRKEYFRAMYHYQCSWGGDRQYHNNLLQIDPAVFN
jgi:group I intron endonuclease